MRKILSLTLALILVVTMLPMSASAASISERELAIQKTCELFPEHSSVIRNRQTSAFSLIPPHEKVKTFEETRQYSENLAITYTEFSDGTAYFALEDYTKIIKQTNSDVLDYDHIQYTCNVTVYSNYDSSKKISAKGVEFVVDSRTHYHPDGYPDNKIGREHILSKGTITSDSTHNADNALRKEWEDDLGPAYIHFGGDLPDARGVSMEVQFDFLVGDDKSYINITNG